MRQRFPPRILWLLQWKVLGMPIEEAENGESGGASLLERKDHLLGCVKG